MRGMKGQQMLYSYSHPGGVAIDACSVGAALPEPATAPCEVVAVLARQPSGAAWHWGARPVAAGHLRIPQAELSTPTAV